MELCSGDACPADLVVLSTSEPLSSCYLDTSALDGESSLKLRQGAAETAGLQTGEDLAGFAAVLEVRVPTNCRHSVNLVMGCPDARVLA